MLARPPISASADATMPHRSNAQPSATDRPALRLVASEGGTAAHPNGRVVKAPWTIGGAMVLVAMDWRGELLAYELVTTEDDRETAAARLWRLVDRSPRPTLKIAPDAR